MITFLLVSLPTVIVLTADTNPRTAERFIPLITRVFTRN
jgi:hypothetical protein